MPQPKEELTLNVPPLDLDIPKPIKLDYNGETIYGWDSMGYATILKVWTGYTLWADNYIHELELESVFTERLNVYEERLKLKDKSIDLLTQDREHAYKLLSDERKDISKLKRQNTIKIVLTTAGGVIVGAVVGLIIGLSR